MEPIILDYFLFLGISCVLYHIFPKNIKWIVLLTASSYFLFIHSPTSLMVGVGVVLANFFGGKWIVSKNKLFKIAIIMFANLGCLVLFKYQNVINKFISFVDPNPDYHLNLLVPLGISYLIFQGIGYIVNIYVGLIKPEKHLGHFTNYLLFFPKIVAGPIEESSSLLPQLKEPTSEYFHFSNGFRLILTGLFKKMVISASIAQFCAPILEQPESAGILTVVATILYPIQIYCDFSGYTDIALGGASFFGVKLSPNFNNPLSATSLTSFWRRWHMSLSEWVGRYIFAPLSLFFNLSFGFKKAGTLLALILGFLIIGIWHGAKWTFVLFALINAIVLGIELFIPKNEKTFRKIFGWLITMGVFTLSCVFFRVDTLSEGLNWLNNLSLDLNTNNVQSFNAETFLLPLLGILFIVSEHIFFRKGYNIWIGTQKSFVRWLSYSVLLFLILALSSVEVEAFIYAGF